MPILNVKVSQTGHHQEIASVLLELTSRILHKKRELTAITIADVPPENWSIGGKDLLGQQLASFHLDIKITEGTNTKDEKAQYLRMVHEAMTRLLGPLAPASYTVIHEVRADAWGYGAQTQERRYVHGQEAQPIQ
jgi:4-oxalocrotonate tautomerase